LKNTYKVKYRDLPFLPLLVILTAGINIYIVYPETLFTYRFFRTLYEDSIITLICWFAMRSYIIWLDKVYPYQKGITKRIALQLPTAIIINSGLLIVITELVQYFYYHSPTAKEVYTHHIWVNGIWVIVQNGIYITLYLVAWFSYLQKEKKKESVIIDGEQNVLEQKLLIRLGNKNIYIDFSSICFCVVNDGLTSIYTNNNEFFLTEKSLDQLCDILPEAYFFRANRQFIIHKSLVSSIEKQENGKIKLHLKEKSQLPRFISVSRTKAPSLKKWMKQISI
jgi:hypothetical protein